jgi:peptide/nickel transport system substrate-binding protein
MRQQHTADGKSRELSRRSFLVWSATGAAGLVLAGCGGAAAPSAAGASKPSTTAGSASSGISVGSSAQASGSPKETAQLVVALQNGGLTNDPARQAAVEDWALIQQVYNGLVRYKPGTYDLEADLAESWDKSKDGKQYTFKLKKGIEFHGSFGEMTSEDVKFTFDRNDDPKVKSVNKGFLTPLDHIDTPDKYTVVFSLKKPFAPFVSLLALGRPSLGAIVSKKAADKYGNENYTQHPIGTGPFVFEEEVPNQSRTLSRNDTYYEGPAYAKSVKLQTLSDQATLGLAIEKGEVHIGQARGDTLTKYKNNPAAQLFTGTTFNTVGVMLNTTKAPFDNVQVRQALALCINQKEIIDGSAEGFGDLANAGQLVPGMPGYDDTLKPPVYDPDKAKSMLAAAGVKGLKMALPVYTGTNWTTVGALMKEQFARAGVDLTVPQLERGALNTKRADKGSDGTIISQSTGPDPDTMLRYLSGSQFPPGVNYAWYSGADDLIEQSETAATDDERAAILKKVQQQLAKDMPQLPLFHQKATVIGSKNYRGFALDPFGGFWIYRSWLA